MPTLWRVFIINECWILSKAIATSTEMIVWFLLFSLLMWHITLIDLQILKNTCIPGIKPTWSRHIILFMHSWTQCASFCWGFLHPCSQWYWPLNFVCVWYLCLTLQSDGGLIEWIHNYSFFYNFLELKFKLLKVYLENMFQVYTYIHTQHKNIC